MIKKTNGNALVVALISIAILGIVIYPLSLWTDRSLEFWMSFIKGTPILCPGWLSFLVTLCLNAVILGLNVLSEIVRLVIV